MVMVINMKLKFDVEGMMCAACSAAVERAVSKLDGVESAQVNLLAKLLTAEFDESKTDSEAIITAVKKAGFQATLHEETPPANTQDIKDMDDNSLMEYMRQLKNKKK